MAEKINKVGQISMWIIIGVLLVASIILFLMLGEKETPEIGTQGHPEVASENILKQCTEEYTEEIIDLLLPQGGFASPKNYELFNGTPVEYLCENAGFYSPCVNQHPVLMKEIKNQIDGYVTERIENCFNDAKKETEKRGGKMTLSSAPAEVDVVLGQDQVKIIATKTVTTEEMGEKKTVEKIEIDIKSPVYNLAMIAMEIAAQEADYCYFEYVGYRILYPRYKIVPHRMSKPTKIYQITDTMSGKTMNIAIRSCAIPAGI